jgi:hypothetical protein
MNTHGTDMVGSDIARTPTCNSQSHPNSASNSSPPQHDCGGDAQHGVSADLGAVAHVGGLSAQVALDIGHSADLGAVAHVGGLSAQVALDIGHSADLGAVAHVGDLLSAQVALDIGHDCFHV